MSIANTLEIHEKERINIPVEQQERDVYKTPIAQEGRNDADTYSSTQSMLAPPDGGWGWMVVLGGGLGLSLIAGFSKTITLVYEQWLERYGQSVAATSSVTSLNGAIRTIGGPLTGLLINFTSHRTVGILAGIFCSLSILATGFMPSLFWIYITYGIIYGIGISMYCTAQLSMVNLYFSKNRGKANAVSSCFYGVGALYMTQLTSCLLEEYGYTGALVIIGAIKFNLIAAAGLFRPLRTNKAARYMQKSVISNKAIHGDREMETIHNGQRTNGPVMETTCDSNRQIEQLTDNRQNQPNCCVLLIIIKGIMKCGSALGFGALGNYGFFACALLTSSFGIVNALNMTLMAGMAEEKGYSKQQVTLTMTLNFVTEIVFRLISGLVFDSPCVRPRRLLVLTIVSVCMGGLTMCQPYMPMLIPSIACWMLQSGFIGIFQAQSSTVISDSVPRSTITSSIGMLRLTQGIGYLIGPFLGGYIRDVTGSYALGYVVAGVQMSALSLVLMSITLCRTRI